MWVLFSPILFLAVAAIVSYLWSRASRGLNWAGLRVVITGGSDGLGLATAKLAAGRGAHVIILARNAARLERAKTEIEVFVLFLVSFFSSSQKKNESLFAVMARLKLFKQSLAM